MAIDPRIALMGTPPQITVQPISPLQQYGQMLSLRDMMQQGQVRDLQMQQGQLGLQQSQMQLEQQRQAVKDDQILRQAYIDAGGDLDKTQTNLMQRGGSPTALMNLRKQILETKKTLAEIDEKQLPGLKYQHEQLAGLVDKGVQTPADQYPQIWPQLRSSALAINPKLQIPVEPVPQSDLPYWGSQFNTQAGLISQEAERRAAQKAQGEAWDVGTKKAAQTIDAVTTPADYAAWLAKQDPAVKGFLPATVAAEEMPHIKDMVRRMGVSPDVMAREAAPTGDFERNFLPSYAAQLGKTVDQLTPAERLAALPAHKVATEDPTTRDLNIQRSKLANIQAQLALDQRPTPEQADEVAQDVLRHGMAPEQMAQLFSTRGKEGLNFKLMVYSAAKKREPDFSWEQAAAEYQLTKSPQFQNTVRYMDSVQESLPLLIDRSQKLANFGVRSIADLINKGKNQFNSIDLKKYNTDRLLLADEVAKILQGGGTGSGTSDAKLAQAEKIFEQSDNPASTAAAAQEVSQLIGFRRKALTRGTYYERAGQGAESAAGAPAEVQNGAPGTYHFDDGSTWVKTPDGKVNKK